MNRTKIMPWNVHDLARLYNETGSGHWFDESSMRFFKSRLTSNFRRLDDKNALFVTTEKGPNGIRAASIRHAKIVDARRKDGDRVSNVRIETVGEFHSMTLAQAKRKLAKLEAKK